MNKQRNLQDKNSCWSKARYDEPIFILRAKDPTAPMTIIHWIAMNTNSQPDSKLDEAFDIAHEMREYRRKHFSDEIPKRPEVCPHCLKNVIQGQDGKWRCNCFVWPL